MKRGNVLLLVFAFSILFSVSIFSFLPMVNATHCRATNEYDCYDNPDGHSGGTYRPKEFSVCSEQDNKFITHHYCQWNVDSNACEAEYIEMFDCGTLSNYAYCGSKDPYSSRTLEDSSGNIFEKVFYYTGYCEPFAYYEDFLGKPAYECVKYPVAEKTTDYLNQLLESKSLILKTALAVLLVALILLIVIYFKPKKKKRKNRFF